MNREPAVKEPTVRVAIVEDDAALREGLGTLIAGTDGYRLTGA